MISRSCSRSLTVIVVLVAIVGGTMGCSGRRPAGSLKGIEEKSRGGRSSESLGLLPGQNRYLPSRDPRNAPIDRRFKIGSPDRRQSPEPGAPERGYEPPASRAGETRFRVQAFASAHRETALEIRGRLERNLEIPVYMELEGGIWRVRLGNENDRLAAELLQERLRSIGFEDAFVVECHGR